MCFFTTNAVTSLVAVLMTTFNGTNIRTKWTVIRILTKGTFSCVFFTPWVTVHRTSRIAVGTVIPIFTISITILCYIVTPCSAIIAYWTWKKYNGHKGKKMVLRKFWWESDTMTMCKKCAYFIYGQGEVSRSITCLLGITKVLHMFVLIRGEIGISRYGEKN